MALFFIGRKESDMTFSELLATLESGILVSAKDGADNEIIKFYSGTSALDNTTEALTVAKIKLVSATSISVILNSGE